MALSAKNKTLKELYMLVRKEAFQFEPQDRVKLDVATARPDGSRLGYAVGGVMYHADTNSLVFHLYDDDGCFVPAKQGPRSIEDLSERQLTQLRDRVETYVEKAMYRARHIEAISNCLDQLPGRSLLFSGNSFPSVMADLGRNGSISYESFCSVFKTEAQGDIMLSGASEGKGPFNYPLNHLTDNGVSTVFSCMGLTLSKAQEDAVKNAMPRMEEEKPARKAVSHKAAVNGRTI